MTLPRLAALVDPLTHQVRFVISEVLKSCRLCSCRVAPWPAIISWRKCYRSAFEIVKVLGTPTREEIRCMNPNYNEFRFPQIKAHPWHKICHERMPPEAIDLASRLLQYSPSLHCTALAGASPELVNKLIPEYIRRQSYHNVLQLAGT